MSPSDEGPALGDDFEIRPAREDELGTLRRIEDDAAELFAQLPAEETSRYRRVVEMEAAPLEVYAEARRNGLLLVATIDGRPVGFALCHEPSIETEAERTLHLQEIDVERPAQGRGIGRALLDSVLTLASERGATRVTLTTYRDVPWNAPWYRRCGFRDLDPSELEPHLGRLRLAEIDAGLDSAPRVAMELRLPPAPEPGEG